MGKTTYSRNPSTSKGTTCFTQLPKVPVEISEYITRIRTRLPRRSRDSLSSKPNNTSRMSSLTEDAFPTPNISEASVEPGRLLNSEKLSEDGHKNQSKLSSDSLTTSNPTLTPKTSRISPLIMSKSTELQRAVEEPTEPTEESAPIFLRKPTSKSSPLRRQSMSRRKARPKLSQREKFQ